MSGGPINHIITDIPSHDISFDIGSFDELIRSQGVKFIHYRAMRCPVGMTDVSDGRKSHPDHSGCSNGFIFTKVGTVTASLLSNSKDKRLLDMGLWDGSTVMSTFPRYYDNPSDQPFHVSIFDRFYLDETALLGNVPLTVVAEQFFIHHESGYDRLKFPVVLVEDLMDARGDRYVQGEDFVIENGQLKWVTSRRPTPELQTGPGMPNTGVGPTRGAVCSIRYRHVPFWYVGHLMHEVRVTQVQDEATGERKLVRMSYQVLLHREFLGQDKDQDQNQVLVSKTMGISKSLVDADASRMAYGSSDGGFGPR